MIIGGVQKLTTLDYPGKIACTIFTSGCNLRCPFCHNASLTKIKDEDYVDLKTLFYFLESRKGLLDGVVISGGEPLYWFQDTIDLIKIIKDMGFLVKLDTNGSFPNALEGAISAGVDYIAMDIKNSIDKYGQTIGIPDMSFDNRINFIESVDIIKNSGVDYEFRTTLVKPLHTASDIKNIANWIGDKNTRYALQNYEDSGDILNNMGLSGFNRAEMEAMKNLIKDQFKEVIIRGV